jgi:DNA-binding CsgD family transcriptional regulator
MSAPLLSDTPAIGLTGRPFGDGRAADGGIAAVDALAGSGRLGQAISLARELLDTPEMPAVLAARLRLTLSSMLSVVGRPDEAVDVADVVLGQSGLPEDVYVAADVHRLIGLVTMGDVCRARARADEILAGDAGPPGDADLAGALAVVGLTAWMEGRSADALGLLGAAVRRSELGPPAVRRLNPRLGIAVVLAAAGNIEAADDAIERAHEGIAGSGDRFWAAGPPTLGAWVHVQAGRLDEAVAAAHVGLDVSDEVGTDFFRASAHWVLGTVALWRGDLAEAARQVAAFQGALRPFSGGLSQGAYVWLAGQLAEAQARHELAADILRPLYDDAAAHRRLLVDEPAAAAWLVRAALASGERWRAASVVACAEQLATASPGLRVLAAASAQAGALLDRDPSAAAWAAARHVHPWARGSAHEDAGVLAAEAGDEQEAAHHLDEAVDAYERAGAVRDATRVRSRIRQLDRSGRGRRRDRPVTGWASLTEAERRVAWVVAEGSTNAQAAADLHLSRHTVDFHLRQIYRKLAIGSRVELARVVVARITSSERHGGRQRFRPRLVGGQR